MSRFVYIATITTCFGFPNDQNHGRLLYEPELHESLIAQAGAEILSPDQITSLVYGASEPDGYTFMGTGQMITQGAFQLAEDIKWWGGRQVKFDVAWPRVAVQHIHGSALSLWSGNLIPLTQSQTRLYATIDPLYLTDNVGAEVDGEQAYAQVTHRQWRNKMLQTAMHYGCTAMSHVDDTQAWRRVGNLGHMLQDTFSQSHVKRVEDGDNCEILMAFSMDVVNWARHTPADKNGNDEGLAPCLNRGTMRVLSAIKSARDAYPNSKTQAASKLSQELTSALCEMWSMSQATLELPAGGAPSFYSSQLDKPVMPRGLVDEEDFKRYLEAADANNENGFFYPLRATPDFCVQPLICHSADLKEAEEGATGNSFQSQPRRTAYDWPSQ